VTRTRFLLLGGVAAVFASASLPAFASADCLPPYCQPSPPNNHFELRKVGHPKTGVVTIRIKVSAPGGVVASGKRMKKVKARAKAAGIFTLRLRLTKQGMKVLRQSSGRQLRVRITFSFTPTGGKARKKVKKLIFRVLRTPKPAGPEEPEGSKAVIASSATIEAGRALIRVFCNGPQSCQGTLTLVASGDVTLGSASFDLEAGVSPLLRLALTPSGKKLLNGGGVRSAMATGTGLHPHEVRLKFASG
jgi:hypothetical protein